MAGTLGQGGAERQLYYSLKALRSMGAECCLICFTQGEYWEEPIRQLGVRLITVRGSNRLFRLLRVLNVIRGHRFDVVQSVHFHTNLYVAVASRICGQKHIGAIRGNLSREVAELGYLGKLCFRLPEFVAVNSRAAMLKAMELGKRRSDLFFLPNVVDIAKFKPGGHGVGNGNLTGAFLGSLRPVKRVDRILQLAESCRRLAVPVEFHIYGQGPLKAELLGEARHRGILDHNVFFMGVVDDTTLAMQAADFVILTSDNEGTPNVILEAMSCGLPVVSTNVGDVSDLVQNGVNGFVVSVGDEQGLLDSVTSLALHRELGAEMGINNRAKMIHYRASSMLDQLLMDLYLNAGLVVDQRSGLTDAGMGSKASSAGT